VARTLFIRLEQNLDHASWQLVENQQPVGPVGYGDLAGAHASAMGAHVVALLPAEDFFITYVRLPGKNRKKLIKALPYAIEDQLVDNIDDLHFALGSTELEGKYLATAVEDSLMRRYCDALRDAGLRADEMVPDVAALLATGDDWTILLEQERALVRATTGMFASDIDTLPIMLENLYQYDDERQPKQITVYECGGADHFSALQSHMPGVEFVKQECAQGIFGIFAQHYTPKQSVNLLQGEYSYRENISKHLKPWIPAAALLCIWLGWQLVLHVGEYVELTSRSEQLANDIRAVYSRTLPKSKPPAPGYERAYMEKQLNELLKRQGQSAGSLQEILSASATVLKNTSGLEINGVQYSAGNLTLELTIRQASEIEQLKQKLATRTGYQISSQASTEKGVTKVRLKISSSE
jgi:general secretion pathway protein L